MKPLCKTADSFGKYARKSVRAGGHRSRSFFTLFAGLCCLSALLSNPSIPAFESQRTEAIPERPAAAQPERSGIDGKLRASIESTLYRVEKRAKPSTKGAAIYRAYNPAQGLLADFSADRMRVSAAKPSQWHLSLDLAGYGYGGRLIAPRTTALSVSANRVEYQHKSKPQDSGLQEWFLNSPRGIEHGFVIASPPGSRGANEHLRLALRFSGDLLMSLDDSRQKVSLRTRDGKSVLSYDHLYVFDTRGQRLPSHFEMAGDRLHIVVDDRAASYPVTVDPMLSFVKKITASDGMGTTPDPIEGDAFGTSVSISGDTAVVGSPLDDDKRGSAYIFDRNFGGMDNWGERKKITASDGVGGDEFGDKVSISGDTVIVGARVDGGGIGAAYIFDRNQGGANNWGEVKKIVGSGIGAGSQFGCSVGISVDTAVVGARSAFPNTGEAYIFERNLGGANNWGERKKITASDAGAGFAFGASAAIDSNTVIIGSSGVTGGGAAYLFDRDQGGANNWGEVKKIVGSDTAANDAFGASVAISSDTAIVGALGKAAQLGAAYVFGRNQGGANNWGQFQKLLASDGMAGDRFGESVAISGDTALVGAGSDNSSQGGAYVYDRNQGGANNWGEVVKLLAGDGDAGDNFGFAVAMSGLKAIVGARGDEAGDTFGKGSAYIFDGTPPPPVCTARTITHSASQTINSPNEVNCGGFATKSSSHWRAFNLSAAPFSFTQPFNIQSVDIGIEEAHQGPPVTINLYTSSMPFPTGFPGSLTLIGTSGPVAITPDVPLLMPVIKNIPVTGVAPAASQLVVEVFHPDLAMGDLFLGFNLVGETDPTYRSAPTCEGTTPMTMSSLGFPMGTSIHLVLNVNGCEGTPATSPPTLNCPANIMTGNDAGQCSASVAFMPTSGGTPAPTVICKIGAMTITSPHTFPVGMTTVDCTATNGNPPDAMCSFTVTVNDTEPPMITCPSNIVTNAAAGLCSAVATFAAMASDNCGSANVMCVPPSGSTFPGGATTVTCTATDASSNTAMCSFTVTVNDTQPPSITCPPMQVISPGVVNYPAPTTSDNCAVMMTVCTPPSGSVFPAGFTTVTCTATDTSGNTAQCSFIVSTFDQAIVSDSGGGAIFINTLTGDYQICCGGMIVSGKGTITKKGCILTLTHNPSNRRLTVTYDTCKKEGKAVLQMPPGTVKCTIIDSNTKDSLLAPCS